MTKVSCAKYHLFIKVTNSHYKRGYQSFNRDFLTSINCIYIMFLIFIFQTKISFYEKIFLQYIIKCFTLTIISSNTGEI
jgi:hypothetical protein